MASQESESVEKDNDEAIGGDERDAIDTDKDQDIHAEVPAIADIRVEQKVMARDS